MKPSDIWGKFCLWLRHRDSVIITFLMQLAVWIVGGIIITFLAAKEFYEKMTEK